jgi:hypothetical protein
VIDTSNLSTRVGLAKFITECSILEDSQELSVRNLHKYLTLINKNYPMSAHHDSHILTQWQSAKDNLNILFNLKGISAPKHPSKRQQILVGVTIGIITFVITSCLTFAGAMYLNSGYIKLEPTQEKTLKPSEYLKGNVK